MVFDRVLEEGIDEVLAVARERVSGVVGEAINVIGKKTRDGGRTVGEGGRVGRDRRRGRRRGGRGQGGRSGKRGGDVGAEDREEGGHGKGKRKIKRRRER